MKIGELLVELGFKADDTKLKDFIHSVGELNMSSIMTTLGLGAMYETVKKIMSVAEATAMGINAFGQETGLSAQKMQQWTHFAEGMGASGDDVANSLKTVQSHLTGLRMGTDFSLLQPFAILNRVGAGITGNEDPFTLLEKVGRVIKNLSPDIRRMVVESMGLSDSMLLVLDQLGSDEWKKAPFNSPEQVSRLMEYHKEVTGLGGTWKTVLTDIGAGLTPVIEGWVKIAQGVLDTIHSHQALIPVLGVVVALIGAAVGLLAPWSLILTTIIVAVGLIAKYWENINHWVTNIYDKLKSMPVLHQMDQLLGLLGPPQSMATLGAGASHKTVTTTNNYKIFGNNPEEIAHKIDEISRHRNSDADISSPVRSN